MVGFASCENADALIFLVSLTWHLTKNVPFSQIILQMIMTAGRRWKTV